MSQFPARPRESKSTLRVNTESTVVHQQSLQQAEHQEEAIPLSDSLPARLLALMNPTVRAERVKRIESLVVDRSADRVRRRRCAEVIADHLLKAS